MAMIQHPWAGKSTAGYRADLGHFCRSKWEANLARFYRFTGVLYVYEPCEFWFPIRRGTLTYKPDFYLPEEDRWVEVKGRFDAKSLTKLRRFRKYCPNERLKIIGKEFVRACHWQGVDKLIAEWE